MVGLDGVPVKASAISLMTSPMIMKELQSSSCHIVYLYIPGASNRTQISVFSGISVLGTENLEEDGNSRRGRKFVLGCFRNLNSHLNFHEPFLGSHYEKLV